jgi:hypothetical protein
MSIHEHLPPQARKDLKEVGWTKGLELAKVARRDGQDFDCATWLHKARELPKEDFRREVEKELTGKETEPSDQVLRRDGSRCQSCSTRSSLEVHHKEFGRFGRKSDYALGRRATLQCIADQEYVGVVFGAVVIQPRMQAPA